MISQDPEAILEWDSSEGAWLVRQGDFLARYYPRDEDEETEWPTETEEESYPSRRWHPDPYLTGLYQDQGIQTEPEVISRGVQTNLITERTEEDINQLVANLPNDFWDEYLLSPPTSTCEDLTTSFNDCRSPDCH